MADEAHILTMKIKYAWWFRYLYQPLVILCCVVCSLCVGRQVLPNPEKLEYWIVKALRFEIVRGDSHDL